jgi:hypothetical protein
VLINQAKELVEKIASKQKRVHLFTMDTDGSDDHCQLDNRSRGAQVMFDFFDEVFNYIGGNLVSVNDEGSVM